MSFRSQILSGLAWIASARLLGQLVTWSITIVVMRILTPADYGLLAMATVLVGFLAMMAQFGAGAAAVQSVDMDDAKLRQIFGFVIVINSGLFLLLFLAAPLIAWFFDEPRLVAIVRVLGVQFILMIFTVIPGAQLSRRLEFKGQSLVDLSGAVVSSVTALGCALAGLGVWALVWASIVLEVWRVAGLGLIAPFWQRPNFSLRDMRHVLMFGGNLTISRILWFFYSQADIVIAGKVLGKELLGVYSVPLHLASLPVQRLSAIVNQVAFPAFARIQHEREKFVTNFLLAIRMQSFAVFPALWGISSIAPEVVTVLLGEKWRAATIPLRLLALVMPFNMLLLFTNTASQGIGRADIALKQVLIASAVMPIAFLIGIRWGVIGLGVAWIVAFPVVLWGALGVFLPVIGLRVADVLQAVSRPALSGFGMYAVVSLVRGFLAPETQILAQMLILIMAGALAYGALAWTLNRKGCAELASLLRR